MRIGFLLVWLALLTLPARAVVPGLMGPLQSILQMLPQLFAVLVGLLGSMLSMTYWRIKFRQHLKPLLGLAGLVLALAALLIWSGREKRTGLLATATPSPSVTPSGPPQSWPSFRGDISGGGTATLDGLPLAEKPPTIWAHSDKEGSEYLSSPVAINDRVYVGGSHLETVASGGSLECLDARDGHLLWRFITPHPVFSSPIVANGRVYCGEGLHEHEDANLFCFDCATGALIYKVPTHGHVESSPTLVADRLLFSAGGDGMYCVDASSGKNLWHTQCGHCDSSAAVGDGRVYLGTAYKSDSAVCLNLETGAVAWKVHQDLPVWGHPSLSGKRVLFGLGNGTFGGSDRHPRGAIVCLEAGSGAAVWRTPLPDSVNTALALSGSDVLVGCRDGYVYCLAVADGSLRWKAHCGKPVLSSLVVQGDTVLAAGGDGCLYALDRSNGKRRWAVLISDVHCESSPMMRGGRLYIGTGTMIQCLGK